jgi:hypothetical protein
MQVDLTTDLTTVDERVGTFKLRGNPLNGAAYVEVLAGGGGGGGGDASAANQTLQLAQETAINAALGTAVASPATNTLLDRVKALLTGIVLAAGSNLIGEVISRGRATNNASSTAYVSNLVVKAAAGTLFGFSGYNSGTTAEFIQVHDAASLPANTAVPVITFEVPARSPFSMDFGVNGRTFSTGIVLAASTTGPTLTLDGTSTWFDAQVL